MSVYATCIVFRGVSSPPPQKKGATCQRKGSCWLRTGGSWGYRYPCALPLYNTPLWPLDQFGRFKSPV